jgi:DNA processing protein
LFSYPTPFTPPTTEDDRLSWLRLIRSRRVGAATFWRLIDEHGSAEAALQALPEIARAAGVEKYAICPEGVVHAERKAGKAAGARLICRGEPAYPQALADLSDPPPVLWTLGDISLLSRPMVALVGARNASSLGTRMARRLAADLAAAGHVVVSGLARGIDAAAHRAALDGGTVAVMAGGVDVIYPPENAELAERIGKNGVRLSEHPPGLEPQARHFPQRNRIISGLAAAVVVVEAAPRSGSLITARYALDQGREVLAVPGHPFDARAGGCNMLIRDGATLVRDAEDVLEVLGQAKTAGAPLPTRTDLTAGPAVPDTNVPVARPEAGRTSPAQVHDVDAAALILRHLGPSPLAEDQLIRDLGLPPAEVAAQILSLELDGQILRQPGGLLSRSNMVETTA